MSANIPKLSEALIRQNAAVLACLHQPELITEKVPIESLLDQLNRDQFQTLVQNMIKFDPSLLEEVEKVAQFLLEHSGITKEISEETSEEKQEKLSKPNSATNPIEELKINALLTSANMPDHDLEQNLAQILKEISSHWEDNVIEFVQKIELLIPKSEYAKIIRLVLPLIDTYIGRLDQSDTEDDNSELEERIYQFNHLLTEAWLGLGFSNPDYLLPKQKGILGQMQRWNAKMISLDLPESFDISYVAVKQGWNYPPLLKVLAGEIADKGAWEAEAPNFADDLAEIRLRILARAERWQEYLNFAAAEGQVTAYLTKLIDLDQLDQAIKLAPELISDPNEALIIAKKLEESQLEHKTERAIEIAQLGLKLTNDLQKYELANWLSDIAATLYPEISLEAKIIAFQLKPSLEIYQKIANSLSPEDWRSPRESLLKILRHDPANNFHIAQAKIEIFLAENLLTEAIQVADNLQASYHDSLVRQVMDAALNQRPDWVSEKAIARAEVIMTTAKAKYYEEAIAWLKYAKKAQLPQSPQRWQAYRQQLIRTHSRKRKLVELLEKI